MKFLTVFLLGLYVCITAHAKEVLLESKTLTLQKELSYDIFWYEPSLDVLKHEFPIKDLYKSPENLVSAYIKAMRAGDYETYLSFWNEEERKEIIRKNALEGKDANFWKETWQKIYVDSAVVMLTRKAVQGDNLVVEVTLIDVDDKLINISVPVKRKSAFGSSTYNVSDEVSKSPFFLYWPVGGAVNVDSFK